MTFPEALKQLRKELNLKQSELASLLHVNATTLNRWETGKRMPTRTMEVLLINTATEQGASRICIGNLKEALSNQVDTSEKPNDLRYAEINSINRLVNESVNGAVVIGLDQYEILYMNDRAAQMAGQSLEHAFEKRCYQFFMHRDSPCPSCRYHELQEGEYCSVEYLSPFTNHYYMINSKAIVWRDKRACVNYITDITEIYRLRKQAEEKQEALDFMVKSLQNRIEFEHDYILKNNENLISFMRSNVTKTSLIESRFIKKEVLDDNELSQLYDKTIEAYAKRIVDSTDQEKFLKMHNSEEMLKKFKKGISRYSMGYRTRYLDGSIGWIKNDIVLYYEPMTRDVIRYEYYYDINKQRLIDGLRG